jgi:YesN/AraC family two-component response regulator
LKRAFEEAEEAVRCRNIAGAGAVVYIEDVRLEGTPALYYPKEKETTLNHFIKNGDARNAKRMLAEFVADLKSQQACLHFHQVQRVFVQLLASFMETADQLRFDLEAAMQTKTNLYGVLLQKRDMNETFSWLEEVIQFLCDRIDSAFRTKSRTYVEEAIRLIERHYADELSLTWVADRLQLNPSYLSRMFKEKQGIGFMEYVTIVRIEKSKQMLLETGMKVKDICDRLGYTKVNSFIRIFKQLTGKTPGEYRKSYEEK